MTDVALYSLDENNFVVFSFANIERVVSGPEEALQIVAYHLFNTPGSNTYDREDGGGLQALVGNALKSDDEINADAAIIVNRATASILRTQSPDKPANATITGLKLQSVQVLRTKLEIQLSILILLLDGNSFQATFRVT